MNAPPPPPSPAPTHLDPAAQSQPTHRSSCSPFSDLPTSPAGADGHSGPPGQLAQLAQLFRREQSERDRGQLPHTANGWDPDPSAASTESPPAGRVARDRTLVKRKFAVIIGYAGTGYSGSQLNPKLKTIEGEVFSALAGAGAVSESNSVHPSKVALGRAARTDAGVHAATNVLSLKLEVPAPVVEAPLVEENYYLSLALKFRHLQHQFGRPRRTSSGQDPVPVTQQQMDDALDRAASSLEHLRSKINALLPPSVRVFALCRTPKIFDARMYASSRRYEYLLPTYAFAPPRPGTRMYQRFEQFEQQEAEQGMRVEGCARPDWLEDAQVPARLRSAFEPEPWWPSWDELLRSNFWSSLPPRPGDKKRAPSAPVKDFFSVTGKQHSEANETPANPASEDDADQYGADNETFSSSNSFRQSEEERKWIAQLRENLRSYRIPRCVLDRARRQIQTCVGQHNFHNFTVRKSAEDPEAIRIMRQFTISEPFLDVQGMEWVKITFLGDSFMLHQIRKMVGMLILMTRSRSPLKLWYEALQRPRIHVPVAPAEGLLLDSPLFTGYHRDLDDRFPLLNFPLYPHIEPHDPVEVRDFKQQHIYSLIMQGEQATCPFYAWIDKIDNAPLVQLDWLNPRGEVPPEVCLPDLPPPPPEESTTRSSVSAPSRPHRKNPRAPSNQWDHKHVTETSLKNASLNKDGGLR